MWPSFGDNMRVLECIISHIKGEVDFVDTAIGGMPSAADINIDGLDMDAATMESLLAVDSEAWLDEVGQIREYLEGYGERLPEQMINELDKVAAELQTSK